MPNLTKLETVFEGETTKTVSLSPMTLNLCLALLEDYAWPHQWFAENEDGTSRKATAEEKDRAGAHQGRAVLELLTEVQIMVYGEIRMFAGDIPDGWVVCRGQALLRADFPDLFAAIGATWGSDSVDNFFLPDSRQASPQGVLTGTEEPGFYAGTLMQTDLPEHVHAERVTTTGSELYYAGGTTPAVPRMAYTLTANSANPVTTGPAGTNGGIDQRGPRFTVFFAIYAGRNED